MFSLFSAGYFDKKAEDTIPVVVFVFMLLFYLAGIAGAIAHALELTALYLVSGTAFFGFLGFRKYGRDFFKRSFGKLRSAGIAVFVVLIAISFIICLHLRVTNWDDLHYWAIFPKDMYVINGVPTGGMSSTLYQDYFPIVQYLYFLAFKLIGHFSEPAMFEVNYLLIIVALLPFFSYRPEKNEGKARYFYMVLAGIFLPLVFTYQLYYCLGVDIIMTVLFGQALIYIFDEKRDLFYYIRFASVTAVLTMTKTTGLIFAAIAIGVVAVENIRLKIGSFVTIFCIGALNLLYYASWKLFCRIKGNTTYLSNVLNSNIEGGKGPALPDYAKDTTLRFIRAFFLERLNGSVIGLTPVIMLVIALSLILICLKGIEDKYERLRKKLEIAVMLCGMAGYLGVMLYIYLFVFDKWEALSMSSYERYIATFFGGALSAAVYFFIKKPGEKYKKLLPVLTAILILTVNYKAMYDAWTPWGFNEKYGDMTALIDDLDDELKQVFTPQMHYGEEIIFVDGKDDMARSKSIPYCAVPYVSRIMSLIDRDSYTAEELLDMAAGRNAKYMVFMKRNEGEKAVVQNEETLFEDGGSVEEDVLYTYDRDRNVLVK